MEIDKTFDMYADLLMKGFSPDMMMTTWKQAKEWGWPVDSLDPSLGVWAQNPPDGPTRFGSVDGEGNFYPPIESRQENPA